MQSDLELVGDEWAVVRQFLPEGWAEQARKTGAWRRSPRAFKDPDTLLRVLLIHLTAGLSLTETAARAKQSGLAEISSVAIHKRLRSCEEWLRWMADSERSLLGGEAPATGRRLRAVDATVVSEPGSTGTDWRLHYAINLSDLQCDFFELTDVHGGETWRRVPVEPGDVVLGDRVYANPAGVAHVVRAGGDVLVRLNPHTLPLFDTDGNRVNVLQAVRGLKVGETQDLPSWVNPKAGGSFGGRLVALKRSAAAARMECRRIEKKASKQQKKVSRTRLKLARYFLLWTTLPSLYPASDILAFYRWRWQVELGFKRLKSLMGLGHLPKKDPATARAWLHGKLLTSLLVERIIQAANSFSPWGY
jgi:Transposase DDE domain